MKKIFKNQSYHLLAYILLGAFLIQYSEQFYIDSIKVLGISAYNWVLFSWITAGVFQFWVMLFWRLEYHLGKISKWFGKSGFSIFRAGFIFFGIARLLSVIPISMATNNSFEMNIVIRLILIIGTTPFIIWGLFSVIKYFGINRAFGADHFFEEYRKKPLENRGLFKYVPNSMYTIVLLLLYHPGLFFESYLGLIVASVHHIFVWVHYFCTEKPDMREIYSGND